jgi:hypothetical protein
MAVSAFDNKSREPTNAELDETLGDAAALLKNIKEHLLDQFEELTHEWKFYGKKGGWTLAIKQKERRILYIIPHSEGFEVVVVLGKRAVQAAQRCALPANIQTAIENAREYVEGRTIRFDVSTSHAVAALKQLVEIKMFNR